VKHLARCLFNFVAGVSLLAGVGVAAVWVRSHYITDAFELEHGFKVSEHELRSSQYHLYLARDALMFSEYWQTWTDRRMISTLAQQPAWKYSRPQPGGVLYLNPLPGSVLGIGGSLGGKNQIDVRLPYWLLVAAFCVMPAIWIVITCRRRRERTRIAQGLCPTCGYDLRATPGRCPECGATPILVP
jgi:hypothetical protein